MPDARTESAKTSTRPLRADGRRNRERVIAAAEEVVRRDGAQASLEEIARQAGVGSATLYRHFPSRHALLEAVFRDGVAQLCAAATAKPGHDPGVELAAWLEDTTVHIANHRGLAEALLTGPEAVSAQDICATDLLVEVLNLLVDRAQRARRVHTTVSAPDLMTLMNAIAVATQNDEASARRLLRLAVTGIQA